MGQSASSKLEEALCEARTPPNQHFVAFSNPGAQCFANSVLEALFNCQEFRERLLLLKQDQLEHHHNHQKANSSSSTPSKENDDEEEEEEEEEKEPTILSELMDLFWNIESNSRRAVVLEPKSFMRTLRKKNQLYSDKREHQDAHEMLIYVLNEIADELAKPKRKKGHKSGDGGRKDLFTSKIGPTLVHSVFQGVMKTETKCEKCGSVTSRNETFFDLSLDVIHGEEESTTAVSEATAATPSPAPSISTSSSSTATTEGQGGTSGGSENNGAETAQTPSPEMELASISDAGATAAPETSLKAITLHECIRSFGLAETLNGNNQFMCDTCKSLQDAVKQTKIVTLPPVLVLNLKRLKYLEKLQRYVKITRSVSFPLSMEITLSSSSSSSSSSQPSSSSSSESTSASTSKSPQPSGTPTTTAPSGDASMSSRGGDGEDKSTRRKEEASERGAGQTRLYELFAVIVHSGTRATFGHYYTVAKVAEPDKWLLFNDSHVTCIDSQWLAHYFGGVGKLKPCAYLLFYGPPMAAAAASSSSSPSIPTTTTEHATTSSSSTPIKTSEHTSPTVQTPPAPPVDEHDEDEIIDIVNTSPLP